MLDVRSFFEWMLKGMIKSVGTMQTYLGTLKMLRRERIKGFTLSDPERFQMLVVC